MVRRIRPALPRFDGAPYAKHSTTEDHARHKSVFFRPWTLLHEQCDSHVPYLPQMLAEHGTWRKSWDAWISSNVSSTNLKNYIHNFQIVYAVRTEESPMDDDEKRSDARLCLNDDQISAALTTNTRRAKQTSSDAAATFKLVEDLWGEMASNCDETAASSRALQAKVRNNFQLPANAKKCMKAANASKRKDTAKEPNHNARDCQPVNDLGSVRMTQQQSIEPILRKWKREMLVKAKGPGQEQVVMMIHDRVWSEACDMDTYQPGSACSEPMRALICGAPGVGKSFITQAAKELFLRLGWTQGQEFQFAAFQAVVADQVGGDTLHHFFHINERRQQHSNIGTKQSRGLNQMRWLFIDEVSQVHATLLATCEENARNMTQDCEPYALDGDAKKRMWGGLNVVCIGDMAQLPPPGRGVPLNTLPDDLLSVPFAWGEPTAQYGLHLLWHHTNKLIELTTQVRCEDAWWDEVLQEMRDGAMTQNTHSFLHGAATTVTGSYLKSKDAPQCGNGICHALCLRQHNNIPATPAQIHTAEQSCQHCREQRTYRKRVASTAQQLRTYLKQDKFKQAISIVAYNDIKFDTCKRRAAEFARDTGQRVLWAPADDVAMCLLDDPKLQERKLSWLSRHDKDCSGLYGMLPLIKGMPVALTSHVDRSEKALLRGTRGKLVGWQLHQVRSACLTSACLDSCCYIHRPTRSCSTNLGPNAVTKSYSTCR